MKPRLEVCGHLFHLGLFLILRQCFPSGVVFHPAFLADPGAFVSDEVGIAGRALVEVVAVFEPVALLLRLIAFGNGGIAFVDQL